MEIIRFLFIFTLLFLSCNVPNRLEGEWELVGDDDCNTNFLGMNTFDYLGNQHGQKIYLSNGKFFNPSRGDINKRYLPEVLSYEVYDDSIFLSDNKAIYYRLNNDTLTMNYKYCNLFFKKVKVNKKLDHLDISKLIYTVTNEEGVLLDSLCINDTEIIIYKDHLIDKRLEIDTVQYITNIFKLINNLQIDYLGKSYDTPVDAYKYTFYFVDNENNVRQIISHGHFITPFEVENLRRYVFRGYNN